MQVLDQSATAAALPYAELVATLRAAFQLDFDVPLRHHHELDSTHGPQHTLLLMPATQAVGFGGVKLVNVVPDNPQRDLPSVAASYLLFDRATGEHLALLEGGELTARRTAAASALAASLLARPDSEHLVIFGAGRIAANLPLAYRSVLPIRTVTICNRSQRNAQQLAERLRTEGFEVHVADDAEQAVAGADIVSCATFSAAPVLHGEWLCAGQHIDLVGGFTPEMREADDAVIRRARVFVDTEHAQIESGDIAVPLATGVLTTAGILGTLGDLCSARSPGRQQAADITLFKSVGSALEDLAAAILAHTGRAPGNTT